MSKALYYPGADRTSQWAFGRYPGDLMNTNCVVLHTTETTGWPSYSTGYYPNLTYHPGQRKWRQHLPLNRSARALENAPGGVETNTANVVQVELIGTCDKKYHARYGGVYWPEAPDAVLEDLAHFLAFMATEWGVKLVAPAQWPSYAVSSQGGTRQRMTATQWRQFYGIAGHMHVPENHHLDPGNIDIARLLVMAERIRGGQPAAPSKPAPKPAPTPTGDTMPTADDIWAAKINPSPAADRLGGYDPNKSYPARDLLAGAEARVRHLEDVTAEINGKLDAILAKLGGAK